MNFNFYLQPIVNILFKETKINQTKFAPNLLTCAVVIVFINITNVTILSPSQIIQVTMRL